MSTDVFTDGIWTWFNEPVSVYSSTYDATFVGWVDATGGVWVGKYDHGRGERSQVRMGDTPADDHNNPAICLLDNGKLLVCYSEHGGDSWCRLSENAGDIRSWGDEVTVNTASTDAYAHVFQMDDANDTIFWFFRRGASGNRPMYYRTSTDDGATWNTPVNCIEVSGERPYLRATKTSGSRIDLAFTTGQPNEAVNSLYHIYMEVNAVTSAITFAESDGTDITSDIPFGTADATEVYDGTTNECWVWDCVNNSDGLRIAFTVFKNSNEDHEYHLATWGGSSWSTEKITDGGTTATPDYLYLAEANYSGGFCIDLTTSDSVYVSREYGSADFRVEHWEKSGSWSKATDVSGDTSSVNGRPVMAIGDTTQRVWWWEGTYTTYKIYDTNIQCSDTLTVTTSKDASPEWSAGDAPSGAEHYLLLDEGSGTPADLTGAYTNTTSGTMTWASDSLGSYLDGFSTSNFIHFDSVAGDVNLSTWWMAILFSNSSSSTYGFGLSGGRSSSSAPIFGIGVNLDSTTNELFGFIRNDANSSIRTQWIDTESSDGDHHVLMMSHDSNRTELHFDGDLVDSDNSAIGTITIDQFALGCLRRTSNALAFPGNIHASSVGWDSIPDPTWLWKDWTTGQFAGTTEQVVVSSFPMNYYQQMRTR